MRPLRLSVDGFASFRDPATVDFEGADYFALVGPTGAGKSSLIDAMAFALYGSVPRYDDRRLVAPVISQGRVEARVGLDFAVGDQMYRVVRVVRLGAKGKGATTKEARLERLRGPDADEVLAGDADGVTVAVTGLLGLSFDHFTKCVVLPQGAFARFLHDKPAARQDLLVELLDLGTYGTVGQLANQDAAAAANRAALAEEQLAGPSMASATPDAVATAADRLAQIDALRARVAASEPVLDELAAQAGDAESLAVAAQERIGLLEAVAVPSDAAALAASRAELAAAVDADGQRVTEAESALAVAEASLAAMPARAALEAAGRDYAERDDVDARMDKGRRVVTELEAADADARHRVERARETIAANRLALEQATHQHLAATLAVSLVVGDPCPVCQQPVHAVPAVSPAPDVDAARAAVAHAELSAQEWAEELRGTGARKATGAEKLVALAERLAQLDAALAGHPDAGAVVSALGAVAAAEVSLGAARDGQRSVWADHRALGQRLEQADAAVVAAWSAFEVVRDGVAALGPPATDRADLAAAWAALATWAAGRRTAEGDASAAATARAAELAVQRDSQYQEVVAQCAAVGVEVASGRRLGESVAEARAAAAAVAARCQEVLAEAQRLRSDVDAATQDAAVARVLAQHLRASGFEKWLLDEVLDQLVTGATQLLRELSSGAYSLTMDAGGSFAVIDHRNADAVRSARTLSGGETFLASLALALALAERLAGFGTAGGGLEAIFLDEGFGTLDPDTLDTVAAAIEGLAAGGRVVGVVTHVRDLADRVPVRFEVDKGPTGSTVRRVEG
jgi:exonuclease SbcC